MNPSDGLWRSIRADQDQALDRAAYLSQAKARRSRSRVLSLSGPRRLWILSAAAALAIACVVGSTLVARHHAQSDLTFSTGTGAERGQVGAWIAAPSSGALPLRFSDGTLFSLEAGSRARVSSIDPNGARIVLEQGRASVSVAHRPKSHWLVDVGPFEVAVVGTQFDVGWDSTDEVFRLELHEGAVLVSGSCLREPKPIAQGHVLRVFCKGGHEEIVETRGDTSDTGGPKTAVGTSRTLATADTANAVAPPELDPVTVRGPPDSTPTLDDSMHRGPLHPSIGPSVVHTNAWRALTSTGRFREALDLVERSGFDEQCRHASGDDLLELGDAARLAGNPGRARQAYEAARARLPAGGRSAYCLGLTAFDQQRDFVVAAHWFEIYLREQPDGRLRREAEGRLFEAWKRAGELDKARTVAEQYLRDYPDGTQAPLARQLTMH